RIGGPRAFDHALLVYPSGESANAAADWPDARRGIPHRERQDYRARHEPAVSGKPRPAAPEHKEDRSCRTGQRTGRRHDDRARPSRDEFPAAVDLRRRLAFCSSISVMNLCILALCAMAVAVAADPIPVMLLDGQSGGTYHDWKAITPVLKKQLDETGLFKV